jgi:hypothetical protein
MDFSFCQSPSLGDCEVKAERHFSSDECSVRSFRWQHPNTILRTPTGTGAIAPQRVRMEAGRIGGGERKRLWKKINSRRQQGRESFDPLSRFPKGESRGGRVPPTPQKRRLPPQEGKPPCAIPQKHRASERFLLTGAGLLMEGLDRGLVDRAHRRTEVSTSPHMLPPVTLSQFRKLCRQMPRGSPLDVLRQLSRCQNRRRCQQQVNVIGRHRSSHDDYLPRLADLSNQVARTLSYPPPQYLISVFRTPDHLILQIKHRVPGSSCCPFHCAR